jgi:hypothetical protein
MDKLHRNNMNNKILSPIENKRNSNSMGKDKKVYAETSEYKIIYVPVLKQNKSSVKENNYMTISQLEKPKTNRSNSFDKNKVKDICQGLFMKFAKISLDDNKFYLSLLNLLKFLKAVSIVDEKEFKTSDLDIIIEKMNHNGHRLSFEQFLDLLVQIALKIDKNFNDDPQRSLCNLIKNYFENYLNNLEKIEKNQTRNDNLNSSTIPNITLIFSSHQLFEKFLDSIIIDNNIRLIINSVYSGLKQIYSTYFYYEVNIYKDKKKIVDGSFKNLIEFSQHFEIIPYLININQISFYWNYIINTENKNLFKDSKINKDNFFHFEFDNTVIIKKDFGNIFIFLKFCLMIVHLSVLSHSKFHMYTLGGNSITDAEKLIYFLEKLQRSKGFLNLERKTHTPHQGKITLIPNKDIIDFINPMIFKELTGSLDFKIQNNANPVTTNTNYTLTQGNEIINKEILINFNRNSDNFELRDLLVLSDEMYSKLENYLDALKEIFQSYSKMGDKYNFNKMGYSSYLKFLKDSDIMRFSNDNRISGVDNSKINLFNLMYSNKDAIKPKKKISKSVIRYSTGEDKNRHTQLSLDRKDFLTEMDASLIFSTLTGFKNFDKRESIKKQFDKNKGYTLKIGEGSQNTMIDKTNNPNTIPLKLDFYLFIKSIELIACKLYSGDETLNINDCMNIFIEKNVPTIIKNFNEFYSNNISKSQIKELLSSIRTTDIVK